MRQTLSLALCAGLLASCTPASPTSSPASSGASPAPTTAQSPAATPAANPVANGEQLTADGKTVTLDDKRVTEFTFVGTNIRTTTNADYVTEGKYHLTLGLEGPKTTGFKASDVKMIYPWVSTKTGGTVTTWREVGGITLPNPDVTLNFTDTTNRLAGTITFKAIKLGTQEMGSFTYTFDLPAPKK